MKTLNTAPKLTLVGAGPGDPDLITLKGIKALAKANVVLYDALLDDDLLEYAPKAEKIFVGKRIGKHSIPQDKINQLIVAKALSKGNVVRLKGGDPFVFGRGTEEIDYASNFGIEIEIIPGISSSTSVPASKGIAVTKRGVSESFWVITGTTSARELSKDIALAAQSSATVVVLMGMSKLGQIVSRFQQADKGNLPVAIIQNGTTTKEKIGIGTVNSIQEVVAQNQLASPAIIVLGEVVAHSHLFQGFYAELQTQNLV